MNVWHVPLNEGHIAEHIAMLKRKVQVSDGISAKT